MAKAKSGTASDPFTATRGFAAQLWLVADKVLIPPRRRLDARTRTISPLIDRSSPTVSNPAPSPR